MTAFIIAVVLIVAVVIAARLGWRTATVNQAHGAATRQVLRDAAVNDEAEMGWER